MAERLSFIRAMHSGLLKGVKKDMYLYMETYIKDLSLAEKENQSLISKNNIF